MRQSRLTDFAVTATMRTALRLTGTTPLEPKVWDPAEARRHHGIPRPAERAAELAAVGTKRQAHAPHDNARQLLAFQQ
ncbi:hypothetical protein [Amycolatopsis sp. lyj-112]|uniref:hypothetical protein n=1 Tax=Amycolatopsis sp. lyj-112 TaxID=2789288 RepID=UPI00397D4496